MSSSKSIIEKALFAAIDDYNAFQPAEQKLEKNTSTVLFSRAGFTKEGKLDSIGLVNLLVLIEEKMRIESGTDYTLNIQEIIDNKETILKNLGSLTDHLSKQ